jgi:carboxypeptidase C (cathepsin A)
MTARPLPRASSAAVVLAILGGVPAPAQSPPEDRIVTTEHQMTLDGRPLRYVARAGQLGIRDNETGDVHGRMFFAAYTVERRPNDPVRPLTFLWNGGPGSSSSLVHLVGFGPRRLGAGGAPIDNQGTWLGFSDLVFVDPIGTGYSRPVKAEYGPEFYQTRGDADSVAEFIRVYRNRFEAWEAPVVLAGESYGVTRAAEVADVLQRRGIPLHGAVLIGLALPLGQLTSSQRTALNVPTYTAAAFANRTLDPALQTDLPSALRKAEAWAAGPYLQALDGRDGLADSDRGTVIDDLARWTGVDASLIDRKSLTIPMPQFSEQLLRDRNLIVGRYDSRLTAPFDIGQQKMYDPTKDPSLKDIIDNVAVVRYLRSALKYESDLLYQGPFGGGYPPPASFRGDWMSVRWNRSPSPAGAPATPPAVGTPDQPLHRAMAANPRLRVFSSCGYYDLVCSYYANEVVARQLDPSLAARVTVRNYGGGHAIYADDAVRMEMRRDVARFLQEAAPTPPSKPAAAREPSPVSAATDGATVTSDRQISIAGRPLRYRSRAGFLPIRVNETGVIHGQVFYVAYTVDSAAGQPRPLMFLWNGGPGSSSTLLHLMGFGPRRIRTTAEPGGSPACECDLEDNDATWLAHADLVFVDPIGTGFSRPSRAEYGAEFYSTLGDIASIAEFVRVYLTRYNAWDQPLFLAGESYGSWRAAGVAEALERRGVRVAGALLISGGVPIGPVIDDELRVALFVPTRTAAAFHHRRLAPDLQADLPSTLRRAEAWARTDYAAALRRIDHLDDRERETVAEQLARFTGLDPGAIDRRSLIVPRQQFAEQLLRDSGRVLARFDTRHVVAPPAPSLRAATVNRYLRSELGFRTDLAYVDAEQGFTPGGQKPLSVGARWNYNQAPPAADGAPPPRPLGLDGPPGGSQPWLRRVMAINPRLKVFVAAGLYDSLNSCAVNDHLVPALEADVRSNFTALCYEGGHAMYDEPRIRGEMTRDVLRFIQETVASPPGRRFRSRPPGARLETGGWRGTIIQRWSRSNRALSRSVVIIRISSRCICSDRLREERRGWRATSTWRCCSRGRHLVA